MPIITQKGSQREFTLTFLVIANIVTIIIPWCEYLLIFRDAPVFLFPYLRYLGAFVGLFMMLGFWIAIIDILLVIPWVGRQAPLLLERYGIRVKINWKKCISFLVVCNMLTIIVPWAIYLYFFFIVPSDEARWGFMHLLPLWYAGVVFAVVNIIVTVVFLLTHQLHRKATMLCIYTMVASAIYLGVFLR